MFLCFCAKFQVSYIVIGREEKEEGWGGGGGIYWAPSKANNGLPFIKLNIMYVKYFTVKVLVIQNSS